MSIEEKDNLQYEKAINKMNLLKSLIIDLVEYNNISDYSNQKDFTININYKLLNGYYVYDIKLIRGSINPKIILVNNIKYKEKLDQLLFKLLKDLIRNDNFDYTIYNDNGFYTVNMKNNIRIQFPNHDNNIFYREIEENFKHKVIKKEYYNEIIDYETKNKVQLDKLLKCINIMKNLFNKLCDLNLIQDYDNTKPYKLKITCKKDIENKCYKYYFNIIRGNNNPTNLLEFSSSIQDNNIVYDEFKKLINEFLASNNFIYTGLYEERNKEIFTLYLNNLLSVEFECTELNDKLFFRDALNIKKEKRKVLVNN